MNILKKICHVSPTKIEKIRKDYWGSNTPRAQWLLKVGQTFFDGYHKCLETRDFNQLNSCALQVSDELRGFYYEGVGAGLGLFDMLYFWKNKESQKLIHKFHEQYAQKYSEVLFVGLGMSYGRSRLSPNSRLENIPSFFRRFVLDGLAFFNVAGFSRSPSRDQYPSWLRASDRKLYDLGVGRCFWFIESGNPERISANINNLSLERRASLWEGLGVSMTYAGKADLSSIQQLKSDSLEFFPHLLWGSKSAYELRIKAHNPAVHSSFAYRNLEAGETIAKDNQPTYTEVRNTL